MNTGPKLVNSSTTCKDIMMILTPHISTNNVSVIGYVYSIGRYVAENEDQRSRTQKLSTTNAVVRVTIYEEKSSHQEN